MNAIRQETFFALSTLKVIKQKVADAFDLRVSLLDSERRARRIARPRQVAMYLAKEMTNRSLPEIGRSFGMRDHTTVMHAIKTIENLMERDPALVRKIEELRAAIVAAPPVDDEQVPEDLALAALAAETAALDRAKTQPGATVVGHKVKVRDLIRRRYRERCVATGVNKAGNVVELMVSPEGTWTVIEIFDAGRARLSACGDRWAASAEKPAPAVAPTPKPQAKTRKCLGCTKPFNSAGPKDRMCPSCKPAASKFDPSAEGVSA